MGLPIGPPIPPMLAQLVRELPADGYIYEPKWDGMRALVFRDGDRVDIRSRHGRPLARYFPELVDGFLSLPAHAFAIDGEIVVVTPEGLDFATVMLRLHPAASRVERLAQEATASFIAFDLLALEDDDLRARPFADRRARLERLLTGAGSPIRLTPATTDRRTALDWLDRFTGAGVDGVVAKPLTLPYVAGKRAMLKVKIERTADCVVAGMRLLVDGWHVGSLLLGLYEAGGMLRHVGVTSSFTRQQRRELLEELRPLATALERHPWERGFGLARSPMGRLAGAAGRWDPAAMSLDWVPLRPERVVEVAYDTLDVDRFRHPARFRRWRPDRDPRSCTFDQFEPPPPRAAVELLGRPPDRASVRHGGKDS